MPNPNNSLSFSFNIINVRALKYLATHPYEFSGEAIDTLLKQLRGTWDTYLAEGMKQGMSIYDLTELVETVFMGTEKGEWWRARRIARTESVGAANMGTVESYKQADVPYKTWLTMRDGRVRPNHRAMEGVSVPTSDLFLLPDGAAMDAPGDPAGGAANVCNDRCTILADFAPPSSANGRTSVPKK